MSTSKRPDEIPGVSPTLATALVASVTDPKAFRSARKFSARVGLSYLPRRLGRDRRRQECRPHDDHARQQVAARSRRIPARGQQVGDEAINGLAARAMTKSPAAKFRGARRDRRSGWSPRRSVAIAARRAGAGETTSASGADL